MSESPEHYARSHGDRVNLLIHVIAVPLFWVATALFFAGLFTLDLQRSTTGFAVLAVSLGLQGVGHHREALPPAPFQGPVDFVTRIFIEQFWRFPTFVLSGNWLKQWRA